MAVDVTIAGVLNLKGTAYTVTEDATPVDPSSMAAGAGQFTIAVPEDAGDKSLYGKTVSITDGARGSTTGTALSATGTDKVVTITVDSRMALLAVTRTAQPYIGTLGGAFTYYVGLVGITSGIVIDSSVTGTAVVFPGWTGNVWDEIKKMAVAMRVEVSLVSNDIVLRPYRQRLAQNYRDSTRTWSTDSSNLAQSVEVYYYQNVSQTNALAYPDGGWKVGTPTENAIQAGEVRTVTYAITSSLSSVSQPVCVDTVSQTYSASSVYTVTGKDGLPVLASQWTAAGGSITVAIGPDTQTLIITITAPANGADAPYTIAMSSGANPKFSSLRIVGSGVFVSKQKLTLKTSVDPTLVSTLVGTTVDNRFISTLNQAIDCGIWAAKSYGAPRYTISVKTKGINRLGDSGSYAYPTFAQFDAATPAGQTFGTWDAANPGTTFASFDATWLATVSGAFANQAFGNVAGARVLQDSAYFRATSATITPTSVDYAAVEDTVFGDVDTAWPAGTTFGTFDNVWAGKVFSDFNIRPLLTVVPFGSDPYPDTFYPDTLYPA